MLHVSLFLRQLQGARARLQLQIFTLFKPMARVRGKRLQLQIN